MGEMNESQLKTKRGNLIQLLGEGTYKEIRNKERNVNQDIDNIVAQIREVDRELALASGQMSPNRDRCPQCGVEVESGVAFCANCGFSIKAYEEQFTGQCNVCGKRTVSGQKYCEICGSLLQE